MKNITELPFDVDVVSAIKLQAGSITCIYENGNLRNIKKGNVEIIRMMYGAVRLDNWDTAAFTIENEKIEQYDLEFSVRYTVRYFSLSTLYKASIVIEGKKNNTISFSMIGKAENKFKSNRIGICTLLPTSTCRAQPVQIDTVSGKIEKTSFPDLISPSQPFYDIKKMEWNIFNHVAIELHFEGDIFEAEDQRNWMDDSFKIYSRPLSLPFPFEVSEEEELMQKVTLKIKNCENELADPGSIKRKIRVDETIPAIGYSSPDEIKELTKEQIVLLNKIPFKQYRVEIYFHKNWKVALDKSFIDAEKLNTQLEIIAFFTKAFISETDELIKYIVSGNQRISSILLLHEECRVTPAVLQDYAYPLLKLAFHHIPVGYGTDGYFAELNRERPKSNSYDFISFSINPQVHVSDTLSLLENLNSLEDIIETIQSFSDKPIHISPVTFKKRKNYDAKEKNRKEVLNNYDERQHTWFGSAWFLLCFYHLRKAERITFFKTIGDSGIIISDSNDTTPIFKILMQLKSFNPAWISKKNNGSYIEIVFGNEKKEKLIFSLSSRYLA
ncbi:MAG: hypothetical protein ABI863_13960 [Ginsengibacter sp.]